MLGKPKERKDMASTIKAVNKTYVFPLNLPDKRNDMNIESSIPVQFLLTISELKVYALEQTTRMHSINKNAVPSKNATHNKPVLLKRRTNKKTLKKTFSHTLRYQRIACKKARISKT